MNADEWAVLERTIEADRCHVIDRGHATFGLWNAIHAKGSRYVCRVRDKTATPVKQVNDLTEAGRAARVISDEVVGLGWKSRHRTRPDHPVRLVCMEVKPSAPAQPRPFRPVGFAAARLVANEPCSTERSEARGYPCR